MRNTSHSLFNELNNILNGALQQINYNQPEKRYQLFSTPEGWVTRIDLPGYKKEDLTLQFAEDSLTLTANNEERGEKQTRYALGDEVNIEGITAKLEHGVLEISLPKKEEKLQVTHQIEIK